MCGAIGVESDCMLESCGNTAVQQAARVGHCTLHHLSELSDAETDVVFDVETENSSYSSAGYSGYSSDDEADHVDVHPWEGPIGRCVARAPTACKKLRASIPKKRTRRALQQKICPCVESESDIAVLSDAEIADSDRVHDSETSVDVHKWQGIGCRISSLLDLSDDDDAELSSTKKSFD